MPELPDVENYRRFQSRHGLHERIEGHAERTGPYGLLLHRLPAAAGPEVIMSAALA